MREFEEAVFSQVMVVASEHGVTAIDAGELSTVGSPHVEDVQVVYDVSEPSTKVQFEGDSPQLVIVEFD